MRNQQKCARIVKNKHNFRHKTEIDSDNYMILYHDMVEAAGVEPASENIPHRHLHAYPEI